MDIHSRIISFRRFVIARIETFTELTAAPECILFFSTNCEKHNGWAKKYALLYLMRIFYLLKYRQCL